MKPITLKRVTSADVAANDILVSQGLRKCTAEPAETDIIAHNKTYECVDMRREIEAARRAVREARNREQ